MPYCMYLRKSRADLEAEARGEGETLARHLQTLTLLAARLNLSVPPDAIYREIVSGDTIAARPMMQRLLQEVQDGKWEGVLCTEVERLARGDTIDQGIVANAFKYSNTRIITTAKTYDPNNEMDEEYFEFSLFMARREYKAIKRRMQAGRAASVREGHYVGGKRPFGYEVVKCKGEKGYTLSQIPEEARIVRMIFDMYLNQEMGAPAIAKRLVAMGSTTYNGKEWDGNSVRKLLFSPVYAGYVQWAKDSKKKAAATGRPQADRSILAKGIHEPIISEEDFNRVQEVAISRRRSAHAINAEIMNPLAGLCKCGMCGYSMARRPNDHGTYMYCRKPSCPNSALRMDTAVALTLDGLRDWVRIYSGPAPLPNAPAAPDHADEIAAAESALATAQRQLATAQEMLERGVYSVSDYLARRDALQQKINNSTAEIQRLKSDAPAADPANEIQQLVPQIQHVLDAWPFAATPSEQNALLRSVISRVEFTKTARLLPTDNPRDHIQVFLFPVDTH